MIATLSGVLLVKRADALIIDVNGVGYEAHISSRTYDKLPPVGEDAFLHIQTNVRDDAITLFGFSDPGEKELFLLLNTVSGVGPKLALSILSGLSTEDLSRAICSKDIPLLTTLSGVGKKTAQRLCVELSDKISASPEFKPEQSDDSHPSPSSDSHAVHDAVSALSNLGYPQHTAWQAVRTVQKNHPRDIGTMKVEELIREALKVLA